MTDISYRHCDGAFRARSNLYTKLTMLLILLKYYSNTPEAKKLLYKLNEVVTELKDIDIYYDYVNNSRTQAPKTISKELFKKINISIASLRNEYRN